MTHAESPHTYATLLEKRVADLHLKLEDEGAKRLYEAYRKVIEDSECTRRSRSAPKPSVGLSHLRTVYDGFVSEGLITKEQAVDYTDKDLRFLAHMASTVTRDTGFTR